MTEVYLKKNQETGRFECYNGLTDEYMQTLNCGNPFMLIPEDEDLEIPGRIESHNIDGYYWMDSEDSTRQKLENGMRGYIAVSYTHLDVYKRQVKECLGLGFDVLRLLAIIFAIGYVVASWF